MNAEDKSNPNAPIESTTGLCQKNPAASGMQATMAAAIAQLDRALPACRVDTRARSTATKNTHARTISPRCQRRPNIDPLSTLNFDPLELMCCYLPAGCAGVLRSSRRALVR